VQTKRHRKSERARSYARRLAPRIGVRTGATIDRRDDGGRGWGRRSSCPIDGRRAERRLRRRGGQAGRRSGATGGACRVGGHLAPRHRRPAPRHRPRDPLARAMRQCASSVPRGPAHPHRAGHCALIAAMAMRAAGLDAGSPRHGPPQRGHCRGLGSAALAQRAHHRWPPAAA